ncbi:efflux RND transporter periplasmic adaptor subunit [Proteobacteria bacterium 005FR1]|nr:efflux RND transporter periplasmic adaptor subunit [Proteobacteria bacterium 005FR1]
MIAKKSQWILIASIGLVLLLAAAGILLLPDDEAAPPPDAGLALYEASGITVGIATVPDTPRVGENRLVVELKNAAGEPVSGADFEAFAEMPAMGSMPAMRAPADLEETAPGHYEAVVNLSMRGEWPLTVAFATPDGAEGRLQFDFATDRPGLQIAAGGTMIEGEDDEPSAGEVEEEAVQRYRSGELLVAVETEPDAPMVGENRLIVDILDTTGEPVADLELDAFAEMPAMGSMPAMRAPVNLERVGPGRFAGDFKLGMRGEWPLTLNIEDSDGAEHRLQFDLATDRPGLQLAAGATPVGEQASQAGEGPIINVDSRRRQMIGVETAEAEIRDLLRSIRAVGQVTYDERLLSQITLKFDGFIGELHADYVGTEVQEGQVLFTVYSPELLAAQREYLEVYGRRANTAATLLEAARQRLLLWDMPPETIEQLEESGEPQPYVPIHAPRSGTVVALEIADGSAAPAGKTLMAIADLSQVWVEAQVYEADLSLLYEGMPSTVFLPYLPDRRYRSEVEFIYPSLSEDSRTGRVRLTLNNESGALKPAMYAEVALELVLDNRLSVPEEAVLVAGATRVVFVDLGGGRLQARRIKTGRRAQGYVEVLEGLEPGDTVVTSGNFLIAAETRLKTGIEQW